MDAAVGGSVDAAAPVQRRPSRRISNRDAATAEEAEAKRRTLVLPQSEEDLILRMLNWAEIDKPPPVLELTPPAD
jgi:hypothetical protein